MYRCPFVSGRNRSVASRKAEYQFLLEQQRIVSRSANFRTTIRTAGFFIGAWFASSAVESMAGTTTIADFGLRVAGSLRLSTAMAWITAAASAAWATWERSLRKKTVRNLAPRHRALERQLDSRRRSSGLNPQDDPPSTV